MEAHEDEKQQSAANLTIDFTANLRLSGYEKGQMPPLGSSDYLGLSL